MKPSLDTIKLAHSGHQKWWNGTPLLPEEQVAIKACDGHDIVGALLDLVAELSVPAPPAASELPAEPAPESAPVDPVEVVLAPDASGAV